MAFRLMNKFSLIFGLTSALIGQCAAAKEYRLELIEDFTILKSQGICLSVELLEESKKSKRMGEKYYYIGVSSPNTVDGYVYESNSYSKRKLGKSEMSVHFVAESKNGMRYFHTFLSSTGLPNSFIDISYKASNNTGIVKSISLGEITQNGSRLYDQVPNYCRP